MSSSFITALAGLRANQSWLDIVGHNLANTNTPGFKASRALFSDQFSRLVKPATSPSGALGGTNPLQIGLGTKLAHVDRNMNQGALNLTGRTFDLALSGRGFFAVSDGTRTFYSRVGSFGLDSDYNMVDVRTGYKVLDADGQTFTVEIDEVVPPKATESISIQGNLPAQVTGPLAEILESSSSLVEGTPATIAGSNGGPFAIPAGETWTMELIVNGGAPQQVSVASVTGSVTAQEIVDAINQLDHVTASVNGAGGIDLVSDKNGESSTIKVTPGAVGKDLAALVGFGTSLVTGTESAATAASDLNALVTTLSQYAVGDKIEISGTDADGTPIAATFSYGIDGTTVQDLVDFLNAQLGQATVSFDTATQKLEIQADATGEAELSLAITDAVGQAGKGDWSELAMAVTTNGTGPDTATSTVEVFDEAGTTHLVTLTFERQDDGTWNMVASVPATEGTMVASTVQGITFNPDGSLVTPSSAQISIDFVGQSTQSIDLALGQAGTFDGLTQFGSGPNVLADSQDGYGVGELASLGVDDTGTIQGFYTNGQSLELGQFGVATFANEMGLETYGDNYLVETPNTGQRTLAGGKAGPAGAVVGGALEESNVDTAEEFVRMIQAQRGFQANARVITAQSALLEEVNNVVA
jgi:flagellar hook protein FlgE